MDFSEKGVPKAVTVNARVVTTLTVCVTGDVIQDGWETTVKIVNISLQSILLTLSFHQRG